MTDMDVFLLLTHYRKSHPTVPEEAIRQFLTETFDIPVSKANLSQFIEQQPSTKQLVHGLFDEGFSPTHIQKYLQLAQSTVSYHLATTPNRPYFNRFWAELRRTWAERKLAVRYSSNPQTNL